MFIEILFKILLFKGGVLIYAEQCIYIFICIHTCIHGGENKKLIKQRSFIVCMFDID